MHFGDRGAVYDGILQVESLLEQLDQKFEDMSSQILDRSMFIPPFQSSVTHRSPLPPVSCSDADVKSRRRARGFNT